MNPNVVNSTRAKAEALTKLLMQRLKRHIGLLPERVRHNFVWAVCRDNIHVFAQLAVLLGRVGSNVEAASFDDSIIKQFAIGCYRQPISMEAHSSDDKLQGIALYTDKTRCQFRISALVFGSGKSFEQDTKMMARTRVIRTQPPT